MKTALFLFLLVAGQLFAQFTTVSGTVTDPNGLPYAFGTIASTIVASSTPVFSSNSQPYFQPTQATALDITGKFVVRLADNTQLSPGGSTWTFTVCSAVGTVPVAFGKGPVCFTVTGVSISGASQTISATLSAAAPALTATFGGGGTPGGSNTQVQFNNSGAFGGSANFTFDSTLASGAALIVNPSSAVTTPFAATSTTGIFSGSGTNPQVNGVLGRCELTGSGTITRCAGVVAAIIPSSATGTMSEADGILVGNANFPILPSGTLPLYVGSRVQDHTTSGATSSYGLVLDGGSNAIAYGGTGGPTVGVGTTNPEGSLTAPIGSIRVNSTGAQDSTFFVKLTGSGNTGWTGSTIRVNGNNSLTAGGTGALTAFTDATSTDGPTAFGFQALNSDVTVNGNLGGETAFGYQALKLANNPVVGAGGNTATGYQALSTITTGVFDTAYGYQSMKNVTGGENTAFGYQSLGIGNGSGTQLTAFGYQALLNNGSGIDNTAMGDRAAKGLTTAGANTAVGSRALTAVTTSNYNSAFGFQALQAITSVNQAGTDCCGDGSGNSGGFNGAFGAGVLRANTTGYANYCFGYNCMPLVTTGHGNAGIGYNTFLVLDTGHDNTALGSEASEQLAGNSGNSSWSVAVGTDAYFGNINTPTPFNAHTYTAVGAFAGQNVASGANMNIFLGAGAGGGCTTCSSNIVIGTDVDVPNDTGANQLNIGNVLYGTGIFADNSGISIGGPAVTSSTPQASGKIGVARAPTTSALEVAGLFSTNDTGAGTGGVTFGSSQVQGPNACETNFGITTLSTGATTTDTGLNCLPLNAIIDVVVYRITTTITTAASFTVGDATTAGRFCASQSTLTAGTTGICFVQADQTGAAGPRQTSAAKVRITTNVNPGAGAIRLIAYYHTWTAPTS